jgi:hypothetical protein
MAPDPARPHRDLVDVVIDGGGREVRSSGQCIPFARIPSAGAARQCGAALTLPPRVAITDSTPSFRDNGKRLISPACSVTSRSSPSRSARR